MTSIQIEAVSASDAEVLVKFLFSTPHNLNDPGVFSYPHVQVLKATRKGKIIAFLPAQLTVTLDAFAINPEATKLEKAMAMHDLFISFRELARQRGVREINFFTADDSTAEFAKSRGVEEVKQRLFRYKIPETPQSLEG